MTTIGPIIAVPEAAQRSLFLRFLGVILVGVAGAFSSIAMPGILMALSKTGVFPPERAATFASVELGGMMISILVIGQILNGKHRKTLLAGALAAIVVGNGLSMVLYSSDAVLLARLLTGIGEGVAVGALGAAATAFPNPDRLFALFMSTNLGLVTAYLFFLPAIVAAWGVESAFVALGTLGVLGLLVLPFFPAATEQAAPSFRLTARTRAFTLSRNAALGLAGCLGLNTGVGMVWPFMGSLGQARGIPTEAISTDLAMATFAGIAAGLCAAMLGLRLGRRLPLTVSTTGLVLSSIGLALSGVDFTLCTIMFLFFWTFATSYFMGTVAAAEDGAKAAVLIPAMQLGGLALGPQLSAPIMSHFALAWIVTGGALLCALSALAAVAANRHTGR